MKGPHALKSGIWSHIWTCIWKSIVTSRIFRDPLRISFPHKTDRLAQMIQPYCRVWRTYSGMKIRDYVLCRASVGMAVAVFSFDNIMRISCGLCSTSRISTSDQQKHNRREIRTSPCCSDCVKLKFYAPKGGQSMPFFYIYCGRTRGHPSFSQKRRLMAQANRHAPKSFRIV